MVSFYHVPIGCVDVPLRNDWTEWTSKVDCDFGSEICDVEHDSWWKL